MHAWINITHPGFSGRQEMPDDGDQWVSWEQMVATLRAKGEAEGRAAMLAREVIELRGEVAKLKPLEMILAKGGDLVQQLSEEVLDLSAKVRQMEEASRLDQSEILRLTRCVAEVIHARLMVAKIDVQGMQSLADSITDQEMRDPDNAEKVWCEKINTWFCEHSSAISPDRVLGEWKTPADHPEWPEMVRDGGLLIGSDVSVHVLGWIDNWGWFPVVLHQDDDCHPPRYFWEDPTDCFKPNDLRERLRGWIPMPPELKALRANQGGSDHA